jgi:hypothetical protein
MIRKVIITVFVALIITGCGNDKSNKKPAMTTTAKTDTTSKCGDNCEGNGDTTVMACKMTTEALRKRKETVLLSLKNKITGKKELENGYAFKFSGSDATIDELIEFIKTERECCDFFTFNLSISGNKSEAWLELTGAKGAKGFICSELGL